MRLAAFLLLIVGCTPKYYELSVDLAKDADGTREVFYFQLNCPSKDVLWYINYEKLPVESENKLCGGQ